MSSAIIKVGFMMIMAILFYTFLNQIPNYLGDYANYIALAFFMFIGVMVVMAGK